LNTSPDIFLVVNSKGQIVFANAAVEKLLGYLPEELLGQTMEILIPETSRGRHVKLREKYAEKPFVRDMRLPGALTKGRRKDGSVIDLDIKLSPVEFEGERCSLAVARDATETAQFDAEMRAKQESLRLHGEQLQREKKARERLLGVVAHDIRGPMSVLTGYTSMAMKGRLGPLTADMMQAVQAMNNVATHLVGIVNDLLDVSVIQDCAVTLNTERVQLTDLLNEAVEIARFLASPRDIQILFDPRSTQSIQAVWDRSKTLQAINNLLSNAVKYSPKGSSVELGVEVVNGQAVISVTDNGMGVAEKDKKHVFDPYYTTPSRPYQGSCVGLGLAIVKSFVTAQGGRVWVEDGPEGTGSIFRMALPVRSVGEEAFGQLIS
jgi:PAS domain S-box-containing protein